MRIRRRPRGFTLIEILIVVVIMVVLAAAVIPKFASTTEDSKRAALEYNMKVMRSQIQTYEAHHFGELPTIENNALPQLTSTTNAFGEIGPRGPDYPLGPYINEALPVNPFDQSNKVTAVAVRGQKPTKPVGNLGGWQYDDSNGAVWPNNPEYYKLLVAEAEAELITP
jgi:prepilin-type N-terminal cleavage/methylation domain-containing protein